MRQTYGDDGFVDVGPARPLRPGEGRAYDLGDRKVAVFRTGDGWVLSKQMD